jgi:hypothetical protein
MMEPHELTAEARRLLDESSPGTVSAWSRAAALLCRQALEDALALLWADDAPCLRRVPMRAQLACLRSFLPEDGSLASEVTFTWNALSRATHHQPYELDPTREELHSLLVATDRLIAAIAVRGQADRSSAELRPGRSRPTTI